MRTVIVNVQGGVVQSVHAFGVVLDVIVVQDSEAALFPLEAVSDQFQAALHEQFPEEVPAPGALRSVTEREVERKAGWLARFVELPPGTRVRATEDGGECYTAGSAGVVLTHADDGCTLVAFDKPLLSLPNKTKPADAWWVDTDKLEVVS